MYYKNALKKTVDYIEANLEDIFSLDDLVSINGFSRCHFSRLFHLFSGYSISDYIRGRRLTEAARILVDTDDKIMDIALRFQFSSQDSFTRSFKQAFNESPAKFRRSQIKKTLVKPLNAEKIVLIQGGQEVKPRIEILDDLRVCGMACTSKNMHGEIPALWDRFIPRMHEIKSNVMFGRTFGVCEALEENIEDVDLDNPGEFGYLAGVQITDDSDIPNGMEVWDVPHKKYAVFTHRGTVHTLGDTYKMIYAKWIPESGYKIVFTYDFEVYGPDYNPTDPNAVMEIYLPIE